MIRPDMIGPALVVIAMATGAALWARGLAGLLKWIAG
jgi:hypothetical protein